MKSKYMRMVCGILAVVMATGTLSACGKQETETVVNIEPMEIEEVDTYSLDVIGGSDVMPILGYYSPLTSWNSSEGNAPRDIMTEEYYEAIAECGINIITTYPRSWQDAPNTILKSMDLAEKYGIGVIVHDTALNGSAVRGTENPLTVDQAVEQLSNYMTHPAFAGVFLYDEPRTMYYQYGGDLLHNLDAYAGIAKILNDEMGVFTYQNLNGIGDSSQKENFEKYLTEYCETQYPNYILFDKYLFDMEIRGKEYGWLYNLASFREYGEKYNIPWWTYIQCGSQWNDTQSYKESITPYYPDEGEFDWSVNMALAFGAKGIAYFALFQPYFFAYGTEQGDYDFQRNCIFGAWGNKNQWYYYAKDINEHIRVIDEVLMNAVSKGVLATGKEAKELCRDTRDTLMEGKAWRELKDVSGDAVIGCFNYQGKTALYVTNASFDYAQKIKLSFVSEYNVKVVQGAETDYVKGNCLTLDMPAGDGVLLVFE